MIQAHANVSLSDRSPHTRKGRKTSYDNSIAVKFNDNISELALVNSKTR